MADVLARIVDRKRAELSGRQSPIAGPTRLSLRAALQRPGARFIMEVKRKSPSGHIASHSLNDAIAAYAPVADAVSVLIDGPDFGGSLDDLREVRSRFDGPILAKDFVVDPLQVREARAAGADAVLAMLSVLGDCEASSVMDEARGLGMDVVVEVHDEDELARALALGATIVGINNRDLHTLAVDLATTERLAPLVPGHVLLVSESGIAKRSDVLRLAPLVDAFLVGSSLMASDNIAVAARSLVFGPVKICGLTRAEDVALAARSGATHAGFIFHPKSRRRINVETARLLVGVARNAGLASVGVFDSADPRIAAVARELGLDSVQIHGPFDPALRAELEGIELIAACAVRGGILDPVAPDFDRILFDNRDGGSGVPFDWSIVDGHEALGSAFIAGGISPANVQAASRLGAFAIDLSSGVERAPGIKDAARMAELFDALRPAGRTT